MKGIQRRRSDVVSCITHFILRILHRYMELALFRRTILVFVFGPQIFTPVRMLLGSLPGNLRNLGQWLLSGSKSVEMNEIVNMCCIYVTS